MPSGPHPRTLTSLSRSLLTIAYPPSSCPRSLLTSSRSLRPPLLQLHHSPPRGKLHSLNLHPRSLSHLPSPRQPSSTPLQTALLSITCRASRSSASISENIVFTFAHGLDSVGLRLPLTLIFPTSSRACAPATFISPTALPLRSSCTSRHDTTHFEVS